MAKKIYVPSTNEFIEVPDEVYYAYYEEVWRIRKALQRAGKCFCPVNQLCKCVGDCQNCPYYREGNELSLDEFMEENGDVLSDAESKTEDLVVNQMLYAEALKEAEKIFPEIRRYAELRLEGKSIREIAEELGIPKSTILSRLEKAKAHLKITFEISF